MRVIASVTIVIALVAAALTAGRARAQEPQSILPALLTEVRGLRAAMEQMASAGPRVQLALGRVQLQEQRLNTLIMRLDSTRQQLAAAQQTLAHHQQEIGRFESALKEGPASEREQLEHMLGMFKGQITTASAEVQRLTAEESSMAADIASEQSRWNEFNQKLEELERALGRR